MRPFLRQFDRDADRAAIWPPEWPEPPLPRVFGEATDGDDGLVIFWGAYAGYVGNAGLMGNDVLLGRGTSVELSGDVVEFEVNAATGDVDFGNDTLIGGDDHDVFYGDADRLAVVSDGIDDLTVTFGRDILFGRGGSDLEGAQSVHGDSYATDIYLTAAGDGDLTVLGGDDVIAPGGENQLYFSQFTAMGDGYHLTLHLGAGSGTAKFVGGDDIVFGGETMSGDTRNAAVVVDGTTVGRAMITGGDDVVIGQDGTHWINGDFMVVSGEGTFTGGDDTLVSGAGDNYITGDYAYINGGDLGDMPDDVDFTAGSDLFIFKDVFGDDVIADFNQGLDRLVFDRDGAEGFDDLSVSYDGRGVVVSFADDPAAGSIELIGVDQLHIHDVVFV